MSWREAEMVVAALVGGFVTQNKELQIHQDIDVTHEDGRSWSVKYQPAAARYGNLAFENTLGTDDWSETRPGNFAVCSATHYAQVIPAANGENEILFFETKTLKAIVAEEGWKERTLGTAANATNGERKFSQARFTLVPVAYLRSYATTTVTSVGGVFPKVGGSQ